MQGAEPTTLCPCGSGVNLAQCCAPYLAGSRAAPTAEALMRSRYSAFVLGNVDYLRRSWHPRTCPTDIRLDPQQRWLGLSVRRCEAGGAGDASGVVEFVARSRVDGRGVRLHETSRFERVDGRWVYVDGTFHSRKARGGVAAVRDRH